MTSETIEQRLARLEKSVGFWKRATLGLAALGGAGLVLGAAYKPKTITADRVVVSEELVVGDAQDAAGAYVAIGVAKKGQDVSDRAIYVENDKQSAYVTVRNRVANASIDFAATEGSVHSYYHTDGAVIFTEASGKHQEGKTRFQLRKVGSPELFWSIGTHPDEGYGFLRDADEKKSLLP